MQKGIPIHYYVWLNISELLKLLLKIYDALKTTYFPPEDTTIDLLWHTTYFLKKFRTG